MKKNQSGFTLIELLVVISIIGILAAMILANMVGIRERAADTKTKGDLSQLKSALRLYYNDHQSYPPTSGDCGSVLNNIITPYANASIIPVGCTYVAGSDVFNACVTLASSAGDDDTKSQIACGMSPEDGKYCVCAQ